MSNWIIKEDYFKSFDGLELFYRSWKPKVESDKAIIVLHRGHEHSGRLLDLVDSLELNECWAFAWDARGHGKSPGDRGFAESVDCLIKDLDAFVKYVSSKYNIPIENIAIIANSIGAVVASTWVHDYAPQIRCMSLVAPAFKIKLYIPFAIPLLRLLSKFNKKAFVTSYVKSSMLTHDPIQAKAYDDDKLITKCISVKILLGFHDISKRIVADAGAINTPTQILSAGSDWVVNNSTHNVFFNSISSKNKKHHVYAGFHHAILHEKDRNIPINQIREFILDSFKSKQNNSFLIQSDKEGFSKIEYEYLKSPPSLFNFLQYALTKLSMSTLGRLSQGISLGWKTGFDSGKTLDYIYENKPRGISFVGKFLDKVYLESIGWKGIRQRKINIKSSLTNVINCVLSKGNQAHILDVASGPGRYILETVSEIPNNKDNIHLHLRDNTEENLDAGKELAKELNINNITFNKWDAFDKNAYKELPKKVDIAIVSGLYELFPQNDIVLNSLNGIYNSLNMNGYLIYTGQPWHPQVEMIARTLINRDGKPWIMRRRIQAEMDAIVEAQGFKKIDMKIDAYGIFTVSIAQKQEE